MQRMQCVRYCATLDRILQYASQQSWNMKIIVVKDGSVRCVTAC